MSSPIDKKTIKHLAELARVELGSKEEEKLATDLGKILDHFKELQELDTKNTESMTGGTNLKNIFREDDGGEQPFDKLRAGTNNGAGIDAFPEKEKGFLKIPPVFGSE